MADIFNSMAKEIKTRQMILREDEELRKARDGEVQKFKVARLSSFDKAYWDGYWGRAAQLLADFSRP